MTGSGISARSDINITPLIDVMLVLLIIFMLVTPMSHHDLDTAIPKPATKDDQPQPDSPLLELDRQGPRLDGLRVPIEALEAHCRERFLLRDDKTLFVRADGDVPYGAVVSALDAAKGGGVERIGIITARTRRIP